MRATERTGNDNISDVPALLRKSRIILTYAADADTA